MGSFDKKIVFDGFEVKQYLTERTSGEFNNFGLGPKTQLKNLLNYIKNNGFYDKFKERFIEMYQFIFSDDIILAVKNNTKLYLYFFTGKESDHIWDRLLPQFLCFSVAFAFFGK